MIRLIKDRIAGAGMLTLTVISGLIVFAMIAGLALKSRPILSAKPISELLWSVSWHPLKGEFGLLTFIAGTLWVTAVAVILAIPICLLAAIYLAEYAPRRLREGTAPLIDLLAGTVAASGVVAAGRGVRPASPVSVPASPSSVRRMPVTTACGLSLTMAAL